MVLGGLFIGIYTFRPKPQQPCRKSCSTRLSRLCMSHKCDSSLQIRHSATAHVEEAKQTSLVVQIFLCHSGLRCEASACSLRKTLDSLARQPKSPHRLDLCIVPGQPGRLNQHRGIETSGGSVKQNVPTFIGIYRKAGRQMLQVKRKDIGSYAVMELALLAQSWLFADPI